MDKEVITKVYWNKLSDSIDTLFETLNEEHKDTITLRDTYKITKEDRKIIIELLEG